MNATGAGPRHRFKHHWSFDTHLTGNQKVTVTLHVVHNSVGEHKFVATTKTLHHWQQRRAIQNVSVENNWWRPPSLGPIRNHHWFSYVTIHKFICQGISELSMVPHLVDVFTTRKSYCNFRMRTLESYRTLVHVLNARGPHLYVTFSLCKRRCRLRWGILSAW